MLPLLVFMQGRDICSKKFSVWPSRLLVWIVDALTSQFTFFLNAQYFDAAGDLLPTKENILHGLHTVLCGQKELSGVPHMRLAPPTIFSRFSNWFTAAGVQGPNINDFPRRTVLG